MKTTRRYGSRSWECPDCHQWIACPHGRTALDKHIRSEHPALYEKQRAYRAELLGEVPA